ncbi:MAG TPA: hypothetical protein PK668_08355 [Myxococcota bacterium]|nr:hypothetical protein [Myxococcota bacterium]HRY93012.1 hypothetical protein [Myxococcota bacterium]HSA20255.1 hypothetical protein [Myxococcota bacterium]
MRRALIAGLLSLCAAAPALAYIPHVDWLMERLAEKRAVLKLHQLKVELRCSPDGSAPKPEVLYLKTTGVVRRERADGSLEICRAGKCRLRQADGKVVERPEWAYLQYLYFADGSGTAQRFERLLAALKVDTKVSTLSRFNARIAWVVGAKEWERDRPQLWLDKDSYLPLRLMVRDGGSIVDLVWRGWGSRATGDWFPASLEVHRDGKPVELCEAASVESRLEMPDELFQLPAK